MGGQPDERRTGRGPQDPHTRSSVPAELGQAGLCGPGLFMEPLPCRMSVSLSASHPPLQRTGETLKSQSSNCGLVFLVTSPHPEATQEPPESPCQNKDTPSPRKLQGPQELCVGRRVRPHHEGPALSQGPGQGLVCAPRCAASCVPSPPANRVAFVEGHGGTEEKGLLSLLSA